MNSMRVSMVVGAVMAAAVATGGTAVAANAPAKAPCAVQAHSTATIYNTANSPVGTLRVGNTASSECSARTYAGKSVVFLSGGGKYVLSAYVNIVNGA